MVLRMLAPVTVLVVDDGPALRAFLLLTLRGKGYCVLTAADGREALPCLVQHRPDVVLLDLAMPVLDGHQFLARLRALGRDIPVVFMTASGQARAEAEAHRVAGYLAKPFSVVDLLQTVARFALTPRA